MTTKIDEGRVRELKRALTTKTSEIDGIANAWQVSDTGAIIVNDGEHAAYTKAVNEAKQIKGLLDAEQFVAKTRTWLNEPEGDSAAGADAADAARRTTGSKSLGEQFMGSQQWSEFKDSQFRGGVSFAAEGTWWEDGSGQKDVYSMAAGTYTRQGFGDQEQRPLIEKLPRRMHIRDLFPPETTTAAVIYGIRQTGFVNAARPVRERSAADGVGAPIGDDTDSFGIAPRSKITFETVTYPISEIRHIELIHQTVLEDEPRLQGVLNRQMIEGIRVSEDQQILFGDGASPNLRGIFNTPGIQIYNQPVTGAPATAAERKTTSLRRAVTRIQLAELAATGVVVNPLDWEDMELEQDSQGRLILVTSIAAGAEERVWRLPVVATTAIPQGKYLLGAFGLAAQLFDRRSASIQISSENRDYFERGALTLRASERLAMTVDRPEAFATGNLLPHP